MNRVIFWSVFLLLVPAYANAYIGPGLGGGLIAGILGFLAAILMLLVGAFWYPMKKLLKKFKSKSSSGEKGLKG